MALPHRQTLFGDISTVRSPLCAFSTHCGARATLGPWKRVSKDCANRQVTCLKCQRTGTESRNLEIKKERSR